MYIYRNPNPQGLFVGDCVIRALAIAMNKSWNEVYIDLCLTGLDLSDMPSSNRVWGEYLKENGYRRYIIPDSCPECYTVKDFCGEYFKGDYILGTGTHVIFVRDGDFYDAWDSSSEVPIFYYSKGE